MTDWTHFCRMFRRLEDADMLAYLRGHVHGLEQGQRYNAVITRFRAAAKEMT